tara:strand:- start:179 stop:430 length:252 start_codon:yes stop_codon:yes gene_type:complete
MMLNHLLQNQFHLFLRLHQLHHRLQQYPLEYQKQHYLKNLDLLFLNLQQVMRFHIYQLHHQNLQEEQHEEGLLHHLHHRRLKL